MASSSSKRRPGKEPMVTEPPSFDARKFRFQFHEGRYHRFMEAKNVIYEKGLDLREGEYPIMRQITRERRWELLCAPLTDISAVMIREFYANAAKENKNSAPYTSYVRGVEVSFSPAAITRALKLRTITYPEPSYEARLQMKNNPDEILQGLCMENTDWERDSKGIPSHIRRINLTPVAKGWYEIVRRSILPTGNASWVTIKRALLTYCILHGGEINLAQLIADSIQEMADSTSKSKGLGHPSTIQRLCDRANVLFEDEDTTKVKKGKWITKKSMEGTNEEEDQEGVVAPRQRKSQREEGRNQAYDAIDMSQLQRSIEELSQQLMQAQQGQNQLMQAQQGQNQEGREKYLEPHPEFMEQFLKEKEEREAWQHQMEEKQERWQQQMMTQQQEFQAQILEGQKEQYKEFKESYDKLYFSQAKAEEYSHNLYQWKNVHHTMGEVRHVQRMEYDENMQARLEYLTHNLPTLNPEIKPFEQCPEFLAKQQAKSHQYTESTFKRLEDFGLSGLLDSVWGRRCPGEEIRDYSKTGKRKKKKGESSSGHDH
ncbi:uncharacterized protein DS421_5g153370 [Arachis hypogaea]|nr:uncharacterized protein DS421_5g153370 [Arachis hypogaea]